MKFRFLFLASAFLISCVGSPCRGDEMPKQHTFLALQLDTPNFGGSAYEILYLCDIDKAGYWDLESRRLELRLSGEVIAALDLPGPDEAKNLGVDRISETSSGFEVNVSYGGGNNLGERTFYFQFVDNKFYLERIRTLNYSPGLERGESWSWRLMTPPLIQNVSISQFLATPNQWKSKVKGEGSTLEWGGVEDAVDKNDEVTSQHSTLTTNLPLRGAAGSGGSEPSNR